MDDKRDADTRANWLNDDAGIGNDGCIETLALFLLVGAMVWLFIAGVHALALVAFSMAMLGQGLMRWH